MAAPIIWGLTDGSAGMVSQVRGVGELLAGKNNGTFLLKSSRRIKPFCWLPGYISFGALNQLTKDSDSLTQPYPDILISSGRRSVALALAIKKASCGKTKLIHLQGPRIPLSYFDLVVPMEHDRLQGNNVISTFAALHYITEEKLAAAKATYLQIYPEASTPHAAIFIGGTTHAYKLTDAHMQKVIEDIRAFAEHYNGMLWLSTSRRTGEKNVQKLKSALPEVHLYSGDGENPYLAWLALAEIIMVTNDSVSMMSETISTGKPVYILKLPEHHNTKPSAFAEALIAKGYAKTFALPLEHYVPQQLDEKEKVVEAILRRMG